MSTTNAPNPRIFSLFGHDYTMRDPGAYGTDALVQEVHKAYYLKLHPEDRDVIRSVFRERYAAWIKAIEDTATDDALLIAAVMVPTVEVPAVKGESPAILAPELSAETLLAMPSWEVSDAIAEAVDFFQAARLEAYRDYLASKGSGESSTTESNAPTMTSSTTQNTTAMTDSAEAQTAEATDPITESTSPSNTKTE